MTSQLNVDTIVDKAGSGGTNVKIGNTSTYVSDGGAVPQNTVQGLCKSWGNVDGSGTSSLTDSFNVASFTDHTTGAYQFTYSNSMTNNLYSVAGLSKWSSGAQGQNIRIHDNATVSNCINTGFIRVDTTNSGNAAFADSDVVCVQVCGDLA